MTQEAMTKLVPLDQFFGTIVYQANFHSTLIQLYPAILIHIIEIQHYKKQ